MTDRERFKLLHGPYTPPRYQLGKVLFCEIRGWCVVKAVTRGRIPWPMVTPRGQSGLSIALCGDLVRAIKRESNLAVCHWWGVTPQTVSKWRKALGVDPTTEGTRRLRQEHYAESYTAETRAHSIAAMNTPEANAKKAAAKVGVPRPPEVVAKMRQNRRGIKHTAETRARMSAAHKARGSRDTPWGKRWPKWQEKLLGKLPDAEVARRTGRTVAAVWSRRQRLRIPSLSGKGRKMAGP